MNIHPFEKAGLGKAPFFYKGHSEKAISCPDGTVKPAGTCAYCGTAIRYQMHIASSDKNNFVVGCDCVQKLNIDFSLTAKKILNEATKRRNQERADSLSTHIEQKKGLLQTIPHPKNPQKSYYDYALWMEKNAGVSGKCKVVSFIQKLSDR